MASLIEASRRFSINIANGIYKAPREDGGRAPSEAWSVRNAVAAAMHRSVEEKMAEPARVTEPLYKFNSDGSLHVEVGIAKDEVGMARFVQVDLVGQGREQQMDISVLAIETQTNGKEPARSRIEYVGRVDRSKILSREQEMFE